MKTVKAATVAEKKKKTQCGLTGPSTKVETENDLSNWNKKVQ